MHNLKNIAQLHYLTQDDVPGFSHTDLAAAACGAGIKWIQLRSKKLKEEVLTAEACRVKKIADKYGATLVINDHVNVAAELGIGLHLGKTDMPVPEARKILGSQTIIGGTANTAEDIIRLADEGADYIGLGPYRFTVTKQNLSPVIAPDELKHLLALQNKIRVIVIGGITPDDVRPIMRLGAHGIAVSAAINMHPDKASRVSHFLKTFELQEV